MKEKSKNKIIGKIITTTVGTNINSNNSFLLTNNNQINNNKNIKSRSLFLPFKGTNHHKRAHSSFKFKNISENVKNTNISNKINLNTIIASINNYKSLGNNEKLNKISIINNNKNNSNNNNIINNNKQNQPIRINLNLEQKNLIKVNPKNIKKIQENFQNKQINEFNSKTVIKKKNVNKSPFRIKETEEQRIKREKQEKEQKDIRDKLQCYLCFGKATKARMCRNCKKIACDKCVRSMLQKTNKCGYCQKISVLDEDIITIPWMEDLTSFFINNVENYQNQKLKNINNEEDMDVKEEFDNNNNNNEKNLIKGNIMNENNLNKEENEDEAAFVQNCDIHKDRKIEYCCLQCNVFFCSKCLMFTNREIIEKHNSHRIIEINNLKKYNINEAMKEYQKLKKSSNNYDKIREQCLIKKEEIKIIKERVSSILEFIKKKS